MRKPFLSLFAVLLTANSLFAQLTGIKTIPGDYATIATAITALNSSGVGAGGVTFNIAAGYTETGNNTITATGTAANPIIFQKSGAGANPTITAGTGTGLDAIFKMIGSDYITFDGISVQENPANTTNAERTEYGFAFFKPNQDNGCQYNTIKNCSISLDGTYYATDPTWGAIYQAFGITLYSAPNVLTNLNTEPSPTTVAAGNAFNVFQNNSITNVSNGIYAVGNRNIGNVNFSDRNNIISNNNIYDIGGLSAAALGINITQLSNTTITNNNIATKPTHPHTCYGIRYQPDGLSGVLIQSNTINISNNQPGGLEQVAIMIYGGGTIAADPAWKTIDIKNNTIQSSNSNYGYQGIYCLYGTAEFENIEGNNVGLSNHVAVSGGGTGIQVQNWWSHQTSITIKNNSITGHAAPGGLTVYGIYSTDNTDLCTIENNRIYNNSVGSIVGIYSASKAGSLIKNNIIDAGPATTINTFTGMQIANEGQLVYNNLISCRATATSSANYVGIEMNSPVGAVPIKLHHNTVYLSGGSTVNNTSKALALNTTQPIQLNNNIFYNNMVAGSGVSQINAFWNQQIITTTNFLSKNNLFYAGTPSATNRIYSSANGNFQTLENFKLHVCSKDINSVTETVPFLSLDYTNPNYLHINPAVPSLVNNMGFATAEVPLDYDGDARNATTPDIGADELSGLAGTLSTPLTPPVLWLKADAEVFTDAGITAAMNGQTVQQWNDQSCNGYNVTQTTVSNRPTWEQYAFNGKPALFFDGNAGNYYLNNLTQNLVSPGAARTVFVVAKKRCLMDDGGALFTFRRTSFMATLEWVKYAGNTYIYSDGVAGSGVNNATVEETLDEVVANNPTVMTYYVPAANANIEFFLNGNQQPVSQAGNVANETGTTGFTVGDREDITSQSWDGWIAEIIVYDRALTTAERQSVENYLQTKYVSAGLPAVFNNIPTSTVSSNSVQTDASWKHTYNTGNVAHVIVSVKDNCLNLGAINSTVYIDATAGLYNGMRYMRRHYTIKPTLDPAGTKRVRLYYTNADFADLQTYIPSLNSASQLVVTKYTGTNEDGVYDPGGGTAVLIPSSQITRGSVVGVNYLEFDVTGFSEFWIHTGNGVLPLQFLSFRLRPCSADQVCLDWKTTHEVNVSNFEVERSTDGAAFYTIARMPARNLSHNEYTYTDNIISLRDTLQAYYRIKQVDQDGRYSYSHIERIGWQQSPIDVYPTSVNTGFHVNNRTTRPAELLLFSADGRLLQRQKLAAGHNEIALAASYRGMLFYKVMLHTQVLVQGKLMRF